MLKDGKYLTNKDINMNKLLKYISLIAMGTVVPAALFINNNNNVTQVLRLKSQKNMESNIEKMEIFPSSTTVITIPDVKKVSYTYPTFSTGDIIMTLPPIPEHAICEYSKDNKN